MKTLAKAEVYFKQIEAIHYSHPEGGGYAYVQFLAYTRELIQLLRPVQKVEKQLDAIEGIRWLFNECLMASFTHRQKAIFENKLSETKEIFEAMRVSLHELVAEQAADRPYVHRQAA